MEKQLGTTGSEGSALLTLRPHEQVFQALPPLGSEEYVAHISSAPFSAVPPEVLARAFRQLPPQSDAAKRTLEKLFDRADDGSWVYLAPLVAYARRQSWKLERDSYEDLFQDALRHIFQTLPTERGEFAERAWNAFCRRELSDAWRERYGRRGERLPQEPLELKEDGDDLVDDPLSSLSKAPPWHAAVVPTEIEAIEGVLKRVISEIPDEFIRAVASEAWLKPERPRLSGRKTPESQSPLTEIFAGKSRFQIMRALRHADAQLAAALLTETKLLLSPDIRAFLTTKLKVRSQSSTRAAKELKK